MSRFNIFVVSGGLGNQLFQIAAASNYALRYDKKIYLDTTMCDHKNNFSFECLNLLKKLREKKIYLTNDVPIFFKVLVKIRKFFNTKLLNFLFYYFIRIINEVEPYRYQKLDTSKSLISIFDGSWQSEKYFFDCKDLYKTILREFLEISNLTLKDTIVTKKKCSQKIALHLRRGDYLRLDGYGILGDDYYSKAKKFIINKFNDCETIAFSDEIDNLKNKKEIKADYYFDDRSMDSKKVLAYMSICDHFITANSTFSWWAAYLGDKSNKVIVTPKKWFISRDKTPDLIPNHWISIENKHY